MSFIRIVCRSEVSRPGASRLRLFRFDEIRRDACPARTGFHPGRDDPLKGSLTARWTDGQKDLPRRRAIHARPTSPPGRDGLNWRIPGGGRMRRPVATITIQSPTQRRASRSASAACRIRATGRGGRQHVVRTRSINGKGAVVDRSVIRLGVVPYVEGNASPRPHSVSPGDRSAQEYSPNTHAQRTRTAEATGNRSGDRYGGRGLLQREVRRPARRRPPRC